MSKYEVCSVSDYKINYACSNKKNLTIDALKGVLLNDLYLHERFNAGDNLKLVFDIDKYKRYNPDLTIEKILSDISVYFGVEEHEISYTTNYSVASGSHRVVIPKYYMEIEEMKKQVINFRETYKYGNEVDLQIYKNGSWIRMPYQSKEGKKGTEHIIIQGEIEDFVLKYIENAIPFQKKTKTLTFENMPQIKNEKKEEEQVTDIETEEEEQEQEQEQIIVTTEADIQKYREYAENDLFEGEYVQGQHENWIKIGTALKALLGETEGLKEWKKQTLKYRNSKKHAECDTLFKYFVISRIKKPMGYLVNIAKKKNLELVKELNKKTKKIETKKTEEENKNTLTDYQKTRIVTDDNTASIKILEDLVSQNLIKYSKGQIFYKMENIWTCNNKQTTNLLIDFVLKSELLIWNDFKGKYTDFAKNLKNAKNVTECVLIKCITNEEVSDDTFLLKLHTSTVGKLVFNNGVLDFPTKRFYPYNTEKEEEQAFLKNIYSCIKINRNYNPIKNEKAYQEISEKIFTNIFDEQKDKMLQFLSRAFAGYFVDKDWAMFRGNRNCGKGVLNELLKATFGDYTKTIPSEYFMCERMTGGGDQAKKNSWLLDLQFTRLAVTQEINYDKADKGVKLNGIVIKGFTSGGDPKYARKNFQDELEFYIDCKLLMCGNDFPVCNTQDTTTTLIEFSSYKQFKQEKWIVERKATLKEQVKNGADENILKELEIYCKADDQIKQKCNLIEWCDAFIHILLDNFSKDKVDIPQKDSEEEEEESLIQKILQDFTITKDPKDKITNKKLKEIYVENEYKDSYKKFRENILGLGAKVYRNKSERGIEGLVYNEKPKPIIEEKKDI